MHTKMDAPIRYIHIAAAIARTIELQREIDSIFPAIERAVLS